MGYWKLYPIKLRALLIATPTITPIVTGVPIGKM